MDDIDFDALDKAVSQIMDDEKAPAKPHVTRLASKPVVKVAEKPKLAPAKITRLSAKPSLKPAVKSRAISDIKPKVDPSTNTTLAAVRRRRSEERRRRVQAIKAASAGHKLVSDIRPKPATKPAPARTNSASSSTNAPVRVTRLVSASRPEATSVGDGAPKITRVVAATPSITQKSTKFSVSPTQSVTANGAVATKAIDGEYSSQTLTAPVSDRETVRYHTSNLSYVERVELDDRLIEADRNLLAGVDQIDDEIIVFKPTKVPTEVAEPELDSVKSVGPQSTPATKPVPQSQPKPAPAPKLESIADGDVAKSSPFVDEVKVEKRPLGEPAKLTNAKLAHDDLISVPSKREAKPAPLYSAETRQEDTTEPPRKGSVLAIIAWLLVLIIVGVCLAYIFYALNFTLG